jgi:hypothetical protein
MLLLILLPKERPRYPGDCDRHSHAQRDSIALLVFAVHGERTIKSTATAQSTKIMMPRHQNVIGRTPRMIVNAPKKYASVLERPKTLNCRRVSYSTD